MYMLNVNASGHALGDMQGVRFSNKNAKKMSGVWLRAYEHEKQLSNGPPIIIISYCKASEVRFYKILLRFCWFFKKSVFC